MKIFFGKDVISKHYQLLHYIVLENQILARYLAEKLNFDFTLPLEELYFEVIDKLDELDPIEAGGSLEELQFFAVPKRMLEIKE